MIEEGVSFALLGDWLGHSDGGVLAAKTYGHIRKVHAKAEAQRVGESLAKKNRSRDAETPGAGAPLSVPTGGSGDTR